MFGRNDKTKPDERPRTDAGQVASLASDTADGERSHPHPPRYPDHTPTDALYPQIPGTPPPDLNAERPRAPRRVLRFTLKEILLPLTLAFALALFIQATVAKPYEIPTGSMMPTIQPSERVLANRFIYHFEDVNRGDIIVFQPPAELHSPVPFVKRVIGLPGDTVEVRAGLVLVNGEAYEVPGATVPAYGYEEHTVPEGMLFVLGDNRNNSVDSHEWDFLSEDKVIGKVFMTYWPLKRLRLLE